MQFVFKEKLLKVYVLINIWRNIWIGIKKIGNIPKKSAILRKGKDMPAVFEPYRQNGGGNMKSLKKIIALILAAMLLCTLFVSCKEQEKPTESETPTETSMEESTTENDTVEPLERTDEIIILYTNDIHTGIHENLGFDALAAYKKEMLEKTPFVTLVDCGDAIQGDYISAASKGIAIMQAMNQVGYDYCIMGNHDFDYQLSGLIDMQQEAKAQYLNCSISYSGMKTDPFKDMKPYEIKDYDGTKIGFVGVTTPNTVHSTTPLYFEEDGKRVVDFCVGDDGRKFYDTVQKTVDAARKDGAEYIVLLAHLGDNTEEGVYSSLNLIGNTHGIDVVLDGHSHNVIAGEFVQNEDGEDVILTSTGTRMANIGKLTFLVGGGFSTELISEYDKKDAEMTAWLDNLKDVYEGFLGKPLFSLEKELSILNEDGLRIVRARETGIGNFVADAYRAALNTDIGMCNGGGVRASLTAGEISELDLINVNPFGNMLCSIEVTGQEVLDMLEYFYQWAAVDFIADGKVQVENGSFMHISGLKCEVDTSYPTSVTMDADENFLAVTGERRVKNVKILVGDTYVDIDPNATYSLATSNYMAKNGGSGMGLFLADHTILVDEAIADYEGLLNYAVDTLGGDLSRYYETEGRIVIK